MKEAEGHLCAEKGATEAASCTWSRKGTGDTGHFRRQAIGALRTVRSLDVREWLLEPPDPRRTPALCSQPTSPSTPWETDHPVSGETDPEGPDVGTAGAEAKQEAEGGLTEEYLRAPPLSAVSSGDQFAMPSTRHVQIPLC